MKFDVILMNPPFARDLHLDFLDKSLDIADKIVIIEPGQWLIQLKENGKYTKENSKSFNIQRRITNHVKSVELNNYNKALNISNKTVCSITCVDMTKTYDDIEFLCVTNKSIVHSLKDCNLIGERKLVDSILKKCKSYKEHMIDHVINPKKYKDYENKGYWFLPYGNYMISNLGTMQTHKWTNSFHTKTKNIDTLSSYFITLGLQDNDRITNKVHIGTRSNNPSDSIYGSKQQLENWQHFVYNNKLPLFINICLTIGENNNSREYVPWLVERQYTDEEIYRLLGITKEEQQLIDDVIKRYDKDTEFGHRFFDVVK